MPSLSPPSSAFLPLPPVPSGPPSQPSPRSLRSPQSPALPARGHRPAWARLLPALACAALAACGGGGGGGAPETATTDASALSTARQGEVLAYVKGKLAARGPQGDLATADAPVWLTATTTASGSVSATGTVVQEAGVDEEDLIKTDGTRILTLEPVAPWGVNVDSAVATRFARLAVHSRDAAGRTQELGALDLTAPPATWTLTRGLLYAPAHQRAAVLAESAYNSVALPVCPVGAEVCTQVLMPYVPTQPRVQVRLLDTRQPAQLVPAQSLEIDGRLVGTRQVGNLVYVVASHAPRLPYDVLPASATAAERQAALDQLQVADVLPRIRVNGGAATPLVTETDCWVQPANTSTQVAVTTVTTIDLATADFARSSRCFVGGSEALYLSATSLVLATTRSGYQTLGNGRISFAPETRTDLHKFALSGNGVAYRASGSVDGHLGWDREKAPYRISEHNGDLRVLSFTGSTGWFTIQDAAATTASPATLTVLREGANATLQTVATLPNSRRPGAIGKPGEQVYGVRFLGDRAYVVTFRQTDPLYVLDLSNPADPLVAGALEVPGFSDWLFPLDNGLLFGVGKDADANGRQLGLKLALFDVRNPAAPALLDSRTLGARGSTSALDVSSHGLALKVDGNRTRLSLPTLLTTGDYTGTTLQLQRIEVDSAARSLAFKPAIALGEGWADLSSTRTLLLGDTVHLLRAGKLSSFDW